MKNMKTSLQNSETTVLEDTPLELVRRIMGACLDAKGSELAILDVQDVFDISDYFIVVSGRSDRQTQGICNRVLQTLEEYGVTPNFVEGYDEGHWILLDFGDVVLHVFYEPIREQYDLEGLWINAKKLVVQTDAAGNEVLKAA